MGIYKLPKNQWTKDGRKYKYYWNEKDKNGKWKKSFSKAYKGFFKNKSYNFS